MTRRKGFFYIMMEKLYQERYKKLFFIQLFLRKLMMVKNIDGSTKHKVKVLALMNFNKNMSNLF